MKRSTLVNHLSAFVILTVILLLNYAAVQQNNRTGESGPKVQIDQDVANGTEPEKDCFFEDTVDLVNRLSPFIVLYNAIGNPVLSPGYPDEELPPLPAGVLGYPKKEKTGLQSWLNIPLLFPLLLQPLTDCIKNWKKQVSGLMKMILGYGFFACMCR